MCLIALAWRAHPRFDLVLAANRDEFHARASDPAARWDDAPVVGGRDREAGGSWLLAGEGGRVAAVTNLRRPGTPARPRSRGALVRDYAAGQLGPRAFLDAIEPWAGEYGPFNLLLFDHGQAWLASNDRGLERWPLAPGVHAVSNGPVGEDWPKMRRLAPALGTWLADGAADPEPLFAALRDGEPADDGELPDTGVGLERERWLSAPFVRSASYGTRCSTVLLRGAGGLRLEERRFAPDASETGRTVVELPPAA